MLIYTNAQSILKKMDELRGYAADRDPGMIMITETWTNETIDNNFLMIKEYEWLQEMTEKTQREDEEEEF